MVGCHSALCLTTYLLGFSRSSRCPSHRLSRLFCGVWRGMLWRAFSCSVQPTVYWPRDSAPSTRHLSSLSRVSPSSALRLYSEVKYAELFLCLQEDDLSLSVNLFGFLLFTRGLGNVLSSPISTVLLTSTQSIAHEKTGFDVDNGRYEKIIIYVGTCFAGAAMITLAGWMRERSLAGARSFIV